MITGVEVSCHRPVTDRWVWPDYAPAPWGYISQVMARGSGRQRPGEHTGQGPWLVHFFQRHRQDDPDESVPGRTFLDSCPVAVAAKLIAIVRAVADAPPPVFSGGGKWEAMHADMSGFYEARADGPGREHFRLFCLLDRHGTEVGLGGASLVIITGARKPFLTAFSETAYAEVHALGAEFSGRVPRSVVR
jgi:hypothetical protein